MKKLIVALAMAVGLTGLAAQNDTTLSFSTSGLDKYADGTVVADGECYALVWVKDGAAFAGFNADGTPVDAANSAVLSIVSCAKNGRCTGINFEIPAAQMPLYAGGSFKVYLLDTRVNGQVSVPTENTVAHVGAYGYCGDAEQSAGVVASIKTMLGVGETSAFSIAGYVCTYSDGAKVLEGERCILVRSREGTGGFKGLTWDYQLVDGVNNEIVKVFASADATGAFAAGELGELEEGWEYEQIVLDTRLPDGSLAGLDDGKPELLSGWGEFMIGSDGQSIVGLRWTLVKIGPEACFFTSGKMFDFDPTKNLAKGLAAVYAEEGGCWQVHELPTAYYDIVPNGVVSSAEGYAMLCEPRAVNPTAELSDPFELEVTYKFLAFQENIKKVVDAISPLLPKDAFDTPDFKNFDAVNAAATQAVLDGLITEDEANAAGEFLMRVKPFWNWNCDFEASFDRPIKKGTYVLAGRYEQAKAFGFNGWVCSAFERDLNPGESIRLLKDNNYKGVYVTYYEICSRVQEFLCGVINLDPANYGTTITVKLNIYDNTGRCNEKGKVEVGTYKYTFCGPLKVNFEDGLGRELVTGEVVNPQPIETNYNGQAMFMLPAPTYDRTAAGNDAIAFVGWSNTVDNTVLTYIPTNTWTTGEPIVLASTWKSAQTVQIAPQTEKPEQQVSIKVTDEWVEENLGEVADLATALTEDVPDSNLKVWQTYVLGMEANGSLKVEDTTGKDDEKALIVSSVVAPAPDTGFKVTYSLDKVEGDAGATVTKPGEEKESKDLSIDLAPVDDTPTGYYKMNVFITPEDDDPADSQKVKIPSENTIGVLKVETAEPIVPIAVPWVSLEHSTKSEQVLSSVSEIVKTSTLTVGDKLSAKGTTDDGKAVYYNWQLDENGVWQEIPSSYTDEGGQTVDLDNKSADEYKVDRGLAVWLERTDVSKPFYLMGKYNGEEKTEVTVSAPPPEKPEDAEYNLIAPSSITDADLNADGVFTKERIAENDQVMMLRNSVPTYFTYKNEKWGYSKSVYVTINTPAGPITAARQVRVEDDATVKAGTGVWYISKGGTPTISW